MSLWLKPAMDRLSFSASMAVWVSLTGSLSVVLLLFLLLSAPEVSPSETSVKMYEMMSSMRAADEGRLESLFSSGLEKIVSEEHTEQ